MKVGTITFSNPAREAVRLGTFAEKLGYDSFWVTDHLMDLSGATVDPWTIIAAISARTKNLVLGSSVTDTQRSHPAKTAQVLATLEQISRGRVILGIGAGEAMNLVPFGMDFEAPERRIGRLAEAIQVMKALWSATRERPVSFRGRFYRLSNAWLDQTIRRPPRVYVGVFGARKALEVVGRHGDGWLPWINTPETYRERVGLIKSAAIGAGRDTAKLEFVAPIFTTLARDRNRLGRILNVVKQALLIERYTLRKLGFEISSGLNVTYQTLLVKEKVRRMLQRAQDSVPDDIAERFLASGSPSQILERIDEFREAGATQLIVQFLDRTGEEMREFSKVLPMIRRAMC